MLNKILVVMLMMAMAGCRYFSTSAVPHVAIPKSFPSADVNSKTVDNAPKLYWWKQFNDEKLNQLIAQGLKQSPDLPIAIGRLEQASGTLLEVKLNWIPAISLLAGYSTNPGLGIPAGFYGTWPAYFINIAKQIQEQKQAQLGVTYHKAMLDGVRLMVIGRISSAYFTLIAEQEALKLLDTLEKDLQTTVDITNKAVAIGLENDISVADFLVAINQIRAQKEVVQNNIVVSQNALHYLLNENPGTIESANDFTRLSFTQIKPGSLPISVLQNRPDIKMAAIETGRARVGVTVAFSENLPAIQLDEFIGEAHLPKSTLAQLTDAYMKWTITPSIYGKIQERKGQYHVKIAKYVKTIRKALQEVDDSLSANRRFKAAYLANDAAMRQYQAKYDLQQGLLKSGLISYKVLMESKIELDSLAIAANQAKLKLALSLVTLYQNLATGYQC